MLQIRNLETGYGKKQVIYDVSMNIAEGEIVGIIGPNGAGKSTILKTISGILPIWSGDIIFNDNSIKRIRSLKISNPVLPLHHKGIEYSMNLQ